MVQQENKLNIAIISPNQKAVSETFIDAHVNMLYGNIFYYHGGFLPTYLSDKNIVATNLVNRIAYKLRKTRNFGFKEWSLFKSFVKEKIDLVLAEYGPTGVACLPVCKQLNLPLVVHFHGYDAHGNDLYPEMSYAYKGIFDYAKNIISVSKVMTQRLVSLGCPVDKIVENPYGPRDEFYDILPDYKSNQFLTVGRFVDKKAPYVTLMVFYEVVKAYPEARLLMIGDGSLLSLCKNLAQIWKIEDKVSFVGSQGHQEVKEAMKSSFCFLQHSITSANGDMEGMPVGILEASAAGLPVISTRHAGIVESIQENVSGFLVDELDVDKMSEYMIKLFTDRKKCRGLGSGGKNHVRNNFNLLRHIEILDRTIAKIAL